MATNQQLIAEALRKKYNKETEENKEKEDLNFWQKAMLGYTQAVGNLQENASNAMEGLFIDAPVSLIGSGLDLVGLDDAAQKLYDFRERNLIQEWMQNGTIDKIKGGIANSLPSGKFVGNVANFLTSTKPAEIASKFTGISNDQIKQAYVGQDANYLPEIVDVLSNQAGNLIGLYAAGNVGGAFGNVGRNLAVGGAVGGKSAEQASLEGASGLEATGYGILSGVIEAGTEQLMNGISSKLFGNGGKFLGISGNNVVKGGGSGLGTALLRIGRNFTEEGLEEVVSELANPIAQMLTYRRGSTYGELFEEQGGLEAVGQAFVLGGLMGGVMETGQTALGSLEMKSLKAYNFVRETESIIELNGKIKEALANGDQLEYAELMNDKQAEINRIKRKYDKFLNDIESGKINTQQILQAVDSFEYQQNIEARQSLGQDIASGILGNDITVQLSQDENLKGSNYDPSTKTITLKDNQVNVSNFQQILMHEIGHAVKSIELSQELINGIDESSYNKMFEETKTKYADEIKGMTEEQAKTYIDEEIASDVLGDMFENTNDFLRSVNELNARGLSRLINYIKQAFKHKPKPKNYRRIMEVLDEAELKTEGEIRNKVSEKKDIDSNIKRIYKEMKDFIRQSSYIKEDRPERIYPKIQTSLNVLTKFAFGEKTSFKANKESLEALQTDDLNYLNNLLDEYLSLPPEKGEPGGLIYDVIQEINKIKNPIDKNINISDFFEYLSDLNQTLHKLIYEFLGTEGDRASTEVNESKLLEFSKKAKDIYLVKDIIIDCWNKSYSNKKIIAKNKELSLEWNKKDEDWKETKHNNDSNLSLALLMHKSTEEAINKSIESHEKAIAIKEKNNETTTEVKQEPVKEEAETTKEVEQEPIKEPRIKYDKNKKANFNIDLPIIDESYRLKGTDFLDEMQADLLTLEEQRNSNAIDEQKYEEKRSLIDEKIVKESNFVGEALSAVNKIDLNNIKEDDFIPKKRQLENLYAYAKRMEQTLQEIGYDNFKYTQLNDDANFYNVYDYVKENNNLVEKSTKPTPKVEKPIEIPKEEIKVKPKVVEETKEADAVENTQESAEENIIKEAKNNYQDKIIKFDENDDVSKKIKISINDEVYNLKGMSWFLEQEEILTDLESKLDNEEITESAYEKKTNSIYEKISNELENIDNALSAFEDYIDIDEVDVYTDIPESSKIVKLFNYANKALDYYREYDINYDFAQLYEDSNIHKVYSFMLEKERLQKEQTKTTKKTNKSIEIPKEEIKVTPKVVEEIKPTEEVKQDVEQKVETQETEVVEQKPIEEKQVKEKKPKKPKLEKLHNEVMNIAASIDKRVAEITRNIEAGENSQTSANEKFDDLKVKYAEKSKKFQKEITDIANKLGNNATKEQKKLGREIVDAVNKMTEQFKDIKDKLDKFNKDIAKKKKQASKPKPKVEKPIEVPKEVVKPKPKVVETTENVAKEVKEEPKNIEKKDKTEQTKVEKKETPKKDSEVKQLDKALKRLETEQYVTKITKTIDGEIKTIYIANRAKSIPDNAKTVKLAAELFNEKVYTKTSAKDIIDSARKYVTERREAGLVFEGEGQEWAQNDIFVIMNELDSVKTKEAKINEITEYLVSKLNKEIRDDNYVKDTIRTKVAEVMDTKGKQSERSKLLEKQQKDFNKEIAKLTTELTKSQQEIEELRYELEFAELQLSEALENKDVNGKEVELALKMAIKVEEKFNKLQDKSSKRIADLKEKLKEKRLLASYLKSEVKRLKISLETHKEKYKEVYKDLKKNITFYDKLMKKKKTIIENSKSKKPVYHPKIGALILELPNFLTRDSINVGGKATRVKFVELKEQLDAIREEIYNDTGLRPSAELTDALDKINEIYKKSQTPDANNKLHNIPVKGTEIELYYTVVNELMNFGMDARKERTFNVKGYENREIKGTKKEIMQNAKTDIERAQKVTKGFKQKKGILKTLTNVTSPRIFFKLLDGYNPNGIMTTFYDSLRMKEAQKMKKQNEYEKEIVDFLKKNSKFTKELRKEVTIDGKKAKLSEFVELYNLFQQKDSADILANEKAIIKLNGEIYSGLTLEELNKLKQEVTNYLNEVEGFKKFDKLVVEMLEKCRADKITTDNDRIGRTNVLAQGERYYPIYAIQELRHQTFDKDGNIQFLCAKDLSFNKSRTQKNMTIEVHDCLNTLLTYTKGMAFYTTCYTEVENMQSILQSHIEPGISYIGRLNDVLSTEKNPRFVIEYLTEFFANYQGYKRDVNWFTTLKRRSSAYYVAGNINSIIRQATSYWAASRYINVFDPKVTLRLYAHKIKQFDDYMPYSIKYRDTDSIMMVQGDFNRNVFDKTSEKLFAITSAVDKWQVELIWRAALIQCGVHEKGISDVERMERVGKAQELADLAVRETQDNTMVTESSRLSQKQDAISQSLTQFRSQPTQLFTTLVDSYLNVYAKKKNGDEITKKDVANIFKASYGVVVSQAMGVAIAMLLKGALDRDEEVNDPKAWANQFAQELIGIIPAIGNFAHITFNGFDTADGKSAIEFGTYDFSVGPIALFMESISQFAEAFNDFSNFDGRFDHDNFIDAIAKYTGLPYGSASRLVKGVFNWVDSEFATKFGIEYTGQKISQKTQINSAINKGNYSQAKAYYRIYTNGIVELDESVISVMFEAYKNGETTSTLRPIPKTITYENEAYEVDTKAFEKEYGRVKKPLLQLSNDKTFKSMDYEEQAQCISKLSNLYYELAKNKVVGNELKPLHHLASSDYNLSKDIVHLVKISNMSSTGNKTKKEQVQEYLKKLNIPYAEKLLISYLAGYKLDNASINKVKSYLKQNMVPYKTVEKMFEEKQN